MQRWLTRRAAIVGAAGVAALIVITFVALYVAQRDRVMPNTTVAGIDVGRMSSDELRAVLDPLASTRRASPVELTFEDRTFTLDPVDVDHELDVDATIEAVMARGRGGLPRELGARLRSLRTAADIDTVDRHDADALHDWVDGVADQVDRELSPGHVAADPDTLDVHVELPHGSARVRRDDATRVAAEALASDDDRSRDLPVDTEPQTVTDAAVEDVAAQVETAIAADLVLRADDDELSFAPSDLARFIEVVEDQTGDTSGLILTVDPDEVARSVGDVGDRFATTPVDASYEASRTPPATLDVAGSTSFSPVEADVDVVPARDGTSFDLDVLVEQLEELLRDGARSADLALATHAPDFTTELAEELRPTHLLGTFTTYHPAGQSRVVNIQLLADTVDGHLLLPGEQFSINAISGRRTCAAGYRPAGAIIAGELVDTCGGGTSQFGTTTFNAAFFAGLQLDQWKAHSWYFTRYPMGREATLSYPELDVKFTNTTDAAIVVRTTYTAGSITVSLYGRPIAERVSAQHSGAFNHRNFSEQVRDDPDRCEGQRSVVQSGAGGFSVNVDRTIERTDGSNGTETISTVYVPQARIIEEGTRDCSPPTPDPAPDDNNGGDNGGDNGGGDDDPGDDDPGDDDGDGTDTGDA